jgi:predicted nucleotidyltransferase/uncharacterized protein (UPF0332 family)
MVEIEKLPEIRDFARAVQKEYGELVKAIVAIGSVVRGELKPKSDIDLFVILDDTEREIPAEEREEIDDKLERMAERVSKRLSIQPNYTLTEFFDYVRVGHPIIYNFVKEGVAIVGKEFFTPWKRLLEAGKITGTREAIESYMEGAPKKLMRAKTVKLLMLAEDCYYAMLNTAQAVLMFIGVPPPVPAKAYEVVKEYLVKPGILEPEYAEWLREIIGIRKRIEHKELLDAKGSFVDEWIERADKFVRKMFGLLSVLELRKREKVLERTHEVMYKAAATALKTLRKLPKKREDIPAVFKQELIDKGLVEAWYWDIWKRIEELKRLADERKIHKVPEREVYQMREHVRKLIRDLARVLKERKKKT